jgi:DNA-binding MarR family transcriptional regulator
VEAVVPTPFGGRDPDSGPEELQAYFQAIASARYVTRKVFRLIDEQVKALGLDPLQHQALIQTFGSPEAQLTVTHLAERLDVGADVASKVVRSLERKGYVQRRRTTTDRRLMLVVATEEGARFLSAVDQRVQDSIEDLQRRMSSTSRMTALTIFSFYVGVSIDPGALVPTVEDTPPSRWEDPGR